MRCERVGIKGVCRGYSIAAHEEELEIASGSSVGTFRYRRPDLSPQSSDGPMPRAQSSSGADSSKSVLRRNEVRESKADMLFTGT